jgi:nucleotidyltransferase substrate binding protein (TIGR01987 family)
LLHGVSSATPRQAIAESYRKEFINNENTWLSMIQDRNLTVHTYDEAFAQEMAERICRLYLVEFDAFLERLQTEVAAP